MFPLIFFLFLFYPFNVCLVCGETPLTPKASTIRYWNKHISNDLPKPWFLLNKASPLNAVQLARFWKLADNNSLSTQLPALCSEANLLCLSDTAPSLDKNDKAGGFGTYSEKNGAFKSDLTYSEKNRVFKSDSTYPEKNGVFKSDSNYSEKNGAFKSDSTYSEKNGVFKSDLTYPEKNGVFKSDSTYSEKNGVFKSDSAYSEKNGVFKSDSAYSEKNRVFKSDSTYPEKNGVFKSDSSYSEKNGAFKSDSTYSEKNGVFKSDSTSLEKNGVFKSDSTYSEKNDNFKSDTTYPGKNGVFKSDSTYSEKNGVFKSDSASLVKNGQNKWIEPGIFFREENLRTGTIMPMPDIEDNLPKRSFLPRSIVSKLPFSVSKIPELQQIFNVKENSTMAKMIKHTLTECERVPSKAETKRCVASVEGMVDLVTSVLGRNVVVRTTENTTGSKGDILIGSVKGINGGNVTKSVSCHQSLFPYLVYYCHSLPKVRVYEADILDPKTKNKVNHGVAICHVDTSAWSPTHTAFLALGSGPGKIEVCHWIFENDMTWAIAD